MDAPAASRLARCGRGGRELDVRKLVGDALDAVDLGAHGCGAAPSRRASTAASWSSWAPSKREMFSRTTCDCDPGTSKPPLVR